MYICVYEVQRDDFSHDTDSRIRAKRLGGTRTVNISGAGATTHSQFIPRERLHNLPVGGRS
jgi:hypothetical protein